MTKFLARARKALVAGVVGAAGAAGVVLADLPWGAMVGAFVLAIVESFAVYWTSNAAPE